MKKKALIIGGGAVALVAVIVALILIFTGGENAYRSIKVFEIDGSCKVERDGDTLDAFKNMALSSGDTFTVGDGSFARLKLDDDKYVYLEANTKINLTATGTATDSKTMVYIERGSMLTEVKKKLSATSSYDIVTPNTTMSIRGTKTLTEVYEDVLGAIKTSAAVVEGQVKFSTIQKDKTGKVVIVSTDLSVGQGFGVTTDSKDLLSEDDVKHVADDGKTVDGQTAEETTHEELGSVLETPAFSDEFLTNIVAVLTRSREEDVEEGFTAEDVTEEELNSAIQVLNDVIEGNVELPVAVEEYIINQAQNYYGEPIVRDTSATEGGDDAGAVQQTVEGNVETGSGDNADPVTGEGTTAGDEAGENLIGDDQEENPDVAEEDGAGDDAQQDEEDDSDGTDEEDGDEAGEGESEEERIAREEKERLEKEEAERLEKEEQDKKDKEEKERLEKEEKEKKKKEEKEKAEKEAAEREAQEAAEREEAERLAREQAEREAAAREQDANTSDSQDPDTSDSHGSSSSSSAAESESVTVTWSGTSHSYQASSSDEAQAKPYKYGTVSLTFKSGSTTLSGDAVPTSFNPGDPLPGTSNSPYVVEVDATHAPYYEFEGWYTTEGSASSQTSSQRLETVPITSSRDEYSLWAAFKPREYTVTLVNKFPEIGTLVVPSGSSGDGLTYSAGQNGSVVASGLHYGDTYYLPEVERLAKWRYTETYAYKNYPYISVADGGRSNEEPNPYIQTNDLLFYSRQSDVNAAKVLVYNSTADSTLKYNPVMFTHAQSINSGYMESQNPRIESISISDNETLYMYFGSIVNIEINDAKINLPGGQAQTLASVVAASQGGQARVKTRVGSSEQYDEYWSIKKRTNPYNNTTDYVLNTVYFGLPIHLPNFSAPEGANPVYTDFTVESRGEFKIDDVETSLYSKSTYSTETPLFTGTGTQHPFPVYNTSNTTELSCTEYVVEVISREYAILDMSGADYHYFYENASNNLEDLGSGKYKIALFGYNEEGTEKKSFSGLAPFRYTSQPTDAYGNTYNEAAFMEEVAGKTMVTLPDDVTYPWYLLGGIREGDYATLVEAYNDGIKSSFPFVAKTDHRLTGYELTYTDSENRTITRRALLDGAVESKFYLFNNNNGWTPSTIAGTNVLVLDTNGDIASPITIKPVFAPLDSFVPFVAETASVGPAFDGDNAELIFKNIQFDFVQGVYIGACLDSSGENLVTDDLPWNYIEVFYTDPSNYVYNTPLLGYLEFDSEQGLVRHYYIKKNGETYTKAFKGSYPYTNGSVSIPIYDLAYIPQGSAVTGYGNFYVVKLKNSEDELNNVSNPINYMGQLGPFNKFINATQKLYFTYETTESYGMSRVKSSVPTAPETLNGYIPLSLQASITMGGYPQFIDAGCSHEGPVQQSYYTVQALLQDLGIIGAGEDPLVTSISLPEEYYSYTFDSPNYASQINILAAHNYNGQQSIPYAKKTFSITLDGSYSVPEQMYTCITK